MRLWREEKRGSYVGGIPTVPTGKKVIHTGVKATTMCEEQE